MANQLDAAIPQIMSIILEVLRENAVTPRLIDNRYEVEAKQYGSTIDILETNAMEARDVIPSEITPAPNNDIAPIKKQLFLNQWKEVPFKLNDKELYEIVSGLRPRVLEEATKTLANTIDMSVLRTMAGSAHQAIGTAGTAPFATDTSLFKEAARRLSTALAARGSDRYMIVDEYAYANAADLDIFKQVNTSGSSESLREGLITRAVGFGMNENQNVPLITASADGTPIGTVALAAAAPAGSWTVILDDGAGALPSPMPAQGALITIAGDPTPYAIAEVNNNEPVDPAATSVMVRLSHPLEVAAAAAAALTFEADHVANIAFHRNAVAFASRQLTDVSAGGNIIQVQNDPVTGLSFRLEVSRQHKQTMFSLDCLWGVKVVREHQLIRLLG